jgi:hypothetical protein
MFPPGTANDPGGELWWPGIYTDGKASGSYTVAANRCTPGNCLIRYCLSDGYYCPAAAPLTVTAAGPIDCVVSAWGEWSTWSEWKPLDTKTEYRTRTRTRTVTTPPANHGVECPTLEEVETETRPLTQPLMGPVVDAMRCTWQLSATPPDQSGGWRAQFRQGDLNVGNSDPSAPYSRSVTVDVGGPYAFSVVWTKTGQTAQTTSAVSKLCQ